MKIRPKLIKWLLSLCLLPWILSCSQNLPAYSYKSKVTVQFINSSDSPCYMWTGHNPLSPAHLILAGGKIDTVLTMKVHVYELTDESDDNAIYQEDRLEYDLPINISNASDSLLNENDYAIREIYAKSNKLKFYWDGRTLTFNYAR